MELSMAVSQFSFFCISGSFKITLELEFSLWILNFNRAARVKGQLIVQI